MKKSLPVFFLFTSFCSLMISCKKESENQFHLIIGQVWTGSLKYHVRPETEPFSVKFNEDGSCIWHVTSGILKGEWELGRDRLIVNFEGGKKLESRVQSDSTLTQIVSDKEIGFIVDGAQLNTQSNMSLRETNWKFGESDDEIRFAGDSRLSYYYSRFRIGSVHSYVRDQGTMRIINPGHYVFMVILPDGKSIWIDGSFGNLKLQIIK